jgi:hypothetical protein
VAAWAAHSGQRASWLQLPWLTVECYLYVRLAAIVAAQVNTGYSIIMLCLCYGSLWSATCTCGWLPLSLARWVMHSSVVFMPWLTVECYLDVHFLHQR